MLRATDFFNLEVWSWFGLMISYLLWVVDFGRRQVRFVGMVLQHLTQGWHPLVLGSHQVRTHAYRWVLLVKKRWQAMRLGVTIPEQTVFEEAVADARQLRSQDMSKELVVCVTHPKPIRARPLQNRQRFRGPPYGIYHEAA